MAYFVTIVKHGGTPHQQTIFAAGPFNRHGDAERCVGHVRRLVHKLMPNDQDLPWCGWGTSRVKYGPMPNGRFNEQLGLPAGRITESPLPSNWWWTEGELPELPYRAPQRRPVKRAA